MVRQVGMEIVGAASSRVWFAGANNKERVEVPLVLFEALPVVHLSDNLKCLTNFFCFSKTLWRKKCMPLSKLKATKSLGC